MRLLRPSVRAVVAVLVALLVSALLAQTAEAATARPESPSSAPSVAASTAEDEEEYTCDDGSPNGTGWYEDDSDCARQIAALQEQGCYVIHDDFPEGPQDTLVADCGEDTTIDCGGGPVTEEEAATAVEWARQAALWDAGQLAQIEADPCLLANWDSEVGDVTPSRFTKNEAKSGPRVICGTVDASVQVRARAPMGLFIAGLMHVTWSACTNGTKLFFDRSAEGRKKAPGKPSGTFDLQGPKQAIFQTTGAFQASDPRAVGIRVPEQAWDSNVDSTITMNPAVLGMLHLGATTHSDSFVAQLGTALPTDPITVSIRPRP